MSADAILPPADAQVRAVYRHRVGNVRVTALSDGYIKGGETILRHIDAEAAKTVLAAAHRYPPVVEVNAFVVEHGGRRLLVDSGSGRHMGRNAGRLATNLAAAGFDPASIDTILLTHIHPDHVGGLTDPATGSAVFPNAELVLSAAEHGYWLDDAQMSRAPPDQRALFFEAPRRHLAAYADRLRLIEEGDILPGVAVMTAAGHTPGHLVCLVSSAGQSMMIWGDTVHVPEVQTAFPDASVVFDVDPGAAARTRRRILDMVATDGIEVVGMHLGFPGPARIDRRGDGYHLIRLPWRHDLGDGRPR